jgi:hypothetical protein
MAVLHFEVDYRNGSRDRLSIDNQRVLVGSAAHCEIRLPAEECAAEALLVEVQGEELYVEALSRRPPVLIDGRPFRRRSLQADEAIQIGTLSLNVSLDDPNGTIATKPQVTPRVFVLAALFLGLGAYAAMTLMEVDGGVVLPDHAPTLWPSTAQTCDQTDRNSAMVRAVELRVSADGKRERSRFVPRDGVAAVAMYRSATACFRSAGDEPSAGETEHDAKRLESAVLEDYQLARLRLERALIEGDSDVALEQVSLLKSMLEQRQGVYTAMLGDLERRLVLRARSKAGKS